VKLVLFDKPGQPPLPGLLTERGVVSVVDVAPLAHTPQATMQALIEHFDELRDALERKARDGEARPLDEVRLRAPLPRPGAPDRRRRRSGAEGTVPAFRPKGRPR
jgi:hypothetical protein